MSETESSDTMATEPEPPNELPAEPPAPIEPLIVPVKPKRAPRKKPDPPAPEPPAPEPPAPEPPVPRPKRAQKKPEVIAPPPEPAVPPPEAKPAPKPAPKRKAKLPAAPVEATPAAPAAPELPWTLEHFANALHQRASEQQLARQQNYDRMLSSMYS